MKKQYINDLADLYSSKVIEENVEPGKDDTNLNTPPELGPKDGGTGRVEGLQAPIDNKDEDDAEGISNKDITQKTEKEEEKSENLNEKSINNCTMTKQNIFDKLYATIMEAEDLDDELDLGGMDDESSDLDELGVEDEGGSDVTVTLTAEEADLLKSIVDKLGGGEDDLDDMDNMGGDDLDFSDDGGDEDPLMEDGETKPAPEGKAGNPKGNSEVGNAKGTGRGNADGKTKGGDGGKPKAHSTKHGDNKPGDNKVGHGEFG